MSNKKWQQARQIIEAALRRKPEERERFLDEMRADDSALREEVESLLIADRQAAIGFIALQFETKPILEMTGVSQKNEGEPK